MSEKPTEELVEAVARAICIADGVGPDLESIGLGAAMAKGQRYKMWEARRKQAVAAIKAVQNHMDSLAVSGLDIHR